ncbi:sensor histidine kinase [Polycladidibacter stylochi]|uniref:sensor histidine kinase n=1 Tax=Polycladidibacter stylochi TaxID=1807766 RepID=UPI00082F7921|nr:HAMP domain-containing sensor histidine kinase [Pseudovibrio stylochi]
MEKHYQTTQDPSNINRERAQKRRAMARHLRRGQEAIALTPSIRSYFEPDLILMFTRNQLSTTYAMPLLATVVALIACVWVEPIVVALWFIVILLVQSGLYFSISHIERRVRAAVSTTGIMNELFAGSAIFSLSWVGFLLLSFDGEVADGLFIFQFATYLIVVAMSTMLSSPLPQAQLVATVPISLCMLALFIAAGGAMHYAMAAMAVGAQVFFYLLSRQLYANALILLEYRAEKDQLISELEQANASSQESRKRAEEANLAKSRFLATMSHELRTPLNAILGFSEVMKDEVLGPMHNRTYLDYAQDINNSGQHLLNLINEILDLSRVEAGRYELHETASSLANTMAACRHMMQMHANQKGLVIHEQYTPMLPSLWADERALRQMILNLLGNAIKFTPDKGDIWLEAGMDANNCQFIQVRDNGPGIPQGEIPMVLEAFGQGAQAINNAEEGTGLGLSIVQAFANLHGAIFELDSNFGSGTTVRLLFPAERSVGASGFTPKPPPIQQERQTSRPFKGDDLRRSA